MVVRRLWIIFAGQLEHIHAKIKRAVSKFDDDNGNIFESSDFFFLFGFNILIVDLLGCFNPTEENKVYQRYYQWIPLVFIVQAAILYMPAHLWKISEGGLMHRICVDLGMLQFR